MDVVDISRIFFSLIAVLGLIGLLAAVARKTGFTAQGGPFVKRKRLALVETLNLDARRRLAVVACDGREFLLVLGAQQETLIACDLQSVSNVDETLVSAEAKPRDAANPFDPLQCAMRRETEADAA